MTILMIFSTELPKSTYNDSRNRSGVHGGTI